MLPELTVGVVGQPLLPGVQEYCVGQQGRDILVAEVKAQHGDVVSDVCTHERLPLLAQQPDDEYLQNHP